MSDTPDVKAAKKKTAKTKTPTIKWRSSAAKQLLMDHLEEGKLPLDEEQCPIEAAWNLYKSLPEFKNVHVDQFRRQLKAHREQVIRRKERLGHQDVALRKFRAENPRKTHNNRGEPVFDMLPGKALLRQDVKDGLHEQMSKKDFRSSRPEYGVLLPKKFKARVYQEIRRQKHLNHQELQRAKQREKLKK